MAVKHSFTCAIADDPASAAAGEILPSHFNAGHVVDDNTFVAAKLSMAATNKIVGSIASTGAAVEIDCTAAGRALLDDADASAQRTTLGLGTAATTAATAYATSAQGTKADTALQPAVLAGEISGLELTWGTATTNIGATIGSAYIEGLGAVMDVGTALNLASPTRSASTMYHVYLYTPNVSTPAVLVSSTVAPAAAPFAGTARSASATISSNAANLHRYLGSYLCSSASNIYDFQAHAIGNTVEYYYQAIIAASPFRLIAGAAKNTSSSTQSLATVCPANVTIGALASIAVGAGAAGYGTLQIALDTQTDQRMGAPSAYISAAAQYPGLLAWHGVSPATPNFVWRNFTGDVASLETYYDLAAYKYQR